MLAIGPSCSAAGNGACRLCEPASRSLPRISPRITHCHSLSLHSKNWNFHRCKNHVYHVPSATASYFTPSGCFDEQEESEVESMDEDISYDDEETEEDDGDQPLDVESLEKEAKDAAREYFSSLVFQAAIGKEITYLRGDWKKKLNRKTDHSKVPSHCLSKVAIVGRPNVGKSALFNRLVPGNNAIVLDEPGITRDRLYGRSSWCGKEFLVVDTGGVHDLSNSNLEIPEELSIATTRGMDGIPLCMREAAIAKMPPMIEKQAVFAVEEASVVIFLVDGQVGVTAADEQIAVWLRKKYSHKHVVLGVNKCESPNKGSMQALDFWSLGFSPLALSATSGRGIKELLEIICSGIDENEAADMLNDVKDRVPSLAFVGRPNVGKSSILNALLGEHRAIVSPISGTTRDAVDTDFTGKQGQKYRLIDTAGIRKRGAIASSRNITEALSVNRSFRAISRSDVVALIIEAMACITEQDCKIADRIEKEGKGCLIVVNKWDTVPGKDHTTKTVYEHDVRQKLRVVDWAPIVYSTAITGDNVDKIITAADGVVKERSRRLNTALLNQVVHEAIALKSPPRVGRRGGRIYYCTQAATRPPTFVFFVNNTKFFPTLYRRYLERKLRSDAGFFGTPVRLLFRNRRKEKNNGDPAT